VPTSAGVGACGVTATASPLDDVLAALIEDPDAVPIAVVEVPLANAGWSSIY